MACTACITAEVCDQSCLLIMTYWHYMTLVMMTALC